MPFLIVTPLCTSCFSKFMNFSTILDIIFADFFTFQQSFSTPQKKRKQIITRKRMNKLPSELPNDSKIRISGNQEVSRKSLKCLDLMASTQPATQPPKREHFAFLLENHQNAAAKHSRGKPTLLNFLNLSTIPCLRFVILQRCLGTRFTKILLPIVPFSTCRKYSRSLLKTSEENILNFNILIL